MNEKSSVVTVKEIAKWLGVEPERVRIEKDNRVSVDISDLVEPVGLMVGNLED